MTAIISPTPECRFSQKIQGHCVKCPDMRPFFLFVVSSADVWSSRALNPSDADLAQQKLTSPEFDSIMREQQENQTNQLTGIAGGSYRLMLLDLPGFIHRSFTDQTYSLQNQTPSRAFTTSGLLRDTRWLSSISTSRGTRKLFW